MRSQKSIHPFDSKFKAFSFVLASLLILQGCINSQSVFGDLNKALNSETQTGNFEGCLSATGINTTSIEVEFEWPEGAETVSILRDGIAVYTSFSGQEGSFRDRNLSEGFTYSYTCSASFLKEDGVTSAVKYGKNQLNASTLAINPPTFLGIDSLQLQSNGNVRLLWKVATGVPTAKYVIVAKLGSAPTSEDFEGTSNAALTALSEDRLKRVEIADDSVTQSSLTGFGDGLTYYFGVQACSISGECSSGDGTSDTLSQLIPDKGAPTSPGLSFAQLTAGQGILTVPWQPSNGRVAIRRIFRCEGSSCGSNISNYANVQNVTVTDSLNPSTSITLTGSLSENRNYSFIVRDEDELLQRSQNTSVRSLSTGDLTPPSGFTGIKAANDLESTSEGQVTVKWNAPSNWSDFRGFLVYTVDSSHNLTQVKDCACSAAACPDQITQCNVTGLTPYRTYNFHVRAYDASGNIATNLDPQFSVASKRAMDSTPPVFSSALQLGYSAGITLTWSSASSDNQYASEPGASISYQVWRKTGSTFANASNPSADADTGAPIYSGALLNHVDSVSAGTYYYTVCALDSSSNSRCDGYVDSRSVADVVNPTISITDTKTTTNKVWDLSFSISDNTTAQAQLAVTVRRKVSSSASDFPSSGDAPLVAQSGLTSLTGQGSPEISGTNGVLRYVNYFVSVADEAGNVGTATRSILLDNAPPSSSPTFASFSPTSPSNTSTTPRVIGSASSNTATVKLYSNGSCTTLLASGSKAQFEGAGIQFTVSANSTTTVYAQTETSAATLGSCVLLSSYTHDNTAPTLASFSINGAATSGANISRSGTWGTLSESITSYCFKMSTTPSSELSAGCSWVTSSSLPSALTGTATSDGSYSFVVWLRDLAGNTSTRIVSSNALTVDSGSPGWSNSLTVPTYTTNDTEFTTSVSMTLNANDSASGVSKYQYAVGTGQASSSSSCDATCSDMKDWTDVAVSSFTPTGISSLSHGVTYYLSARVLDVSGNYRVYSLPFIADLVNPTAPVITSVGESDNVVVTAGTGNTWTGTCDSSAGNVTTVTGGTSVTISSYSCSGGVLTVALKITGLSPTVPIARSISAFTTKPSQRVSSTSTRSVLATFVCPTNYLLVPGNSTYGTTDFCLAKFEMKAVTSNPILGTANIANTTYNVPDTTYSTSVWPDSRPDAIPWAINPRQATQACDRLNGVSPNGTGPIQLMTNAQWQTVAVNTASTASNWSGNAVGSGTIAKGNTDGAFSDPNQGTAAGVVYGGWGSGWPVIAAASANLTTVPWPWTASPNPSAEFAEGYRGTGNNSGSGWDQRRTLYLSTGQVIWDLPGNAWEWVRFTESAGSLDSGLSTPSGAANSAANYNFRLLPLQSNTATTGNQPLSNPAVFSSSFTCMLLGVGSSCTGNGGLNPLWFQPNGSFWNNTAGTRPSDFNLGSIDMVNSGAAATYAIRRGGEALSAINPGIFSANISSLPTDTGGGRGGFRCAINP